MNLKIAERSLMYHDGTSSNDSAKKVRRITRSCRDTRSL